MRRRRRMTGGVRAGGVCCGVLDGSWATCVQVAVVGLMMCVWCFGGVAVAAGEGCPNEVLRVGPSAGLPDCRAYELVTPANLGRAQDMTFTNNDHAIPSSDGEHLALEAEGTALEPNVENSPDVEGSHVVFSRTSGGWVMRSATAPGASLDHMTMELFSPDLSQIAITSYTLLNQADKSALGMEVGPVGGPYTLVASAPQGTESEFIGANAGTADVRAFSDVLLSSHDHGLPLAEPEHAVAEKTVEGMSDLYDWAEGRLRLVNVTSGGALTSLCGAKLGEAGIAEGEGAPGAVSDDGSKVFFTSPGASAGEASCNEPRRLYMRVDGRETIEVSKPEQGVSVAPSERSAVRYNGATPDGEEVFFNTGTPLTGRTVEEEEKGLQNKLFMYNTVTGVLTRIASGVPANAGEDHSVVISEDGSTVYYEKGPKGADPRPIFRYEMATGKTSFVASAQIPAGESERFYTTPDGEFLVFPSRGVAGEPRGNPSRKEDNELYRYDAVDGSVMCVSCGEGIAPVEGEMIEPGPIAHPKEPQDAVPA